MGIAMNLAPLPVDTVTDDEWRAACAVRDARNTDQWARNGLSAHLAAEMALDAVTGSIERSLRVMATVDDAHRCLARAAHPAGMFLGHENAALPQRSALLEDAAPGGREPSDPGMISQASRADSLMRFGAGSAVTAEGQRGHRPGPLGHPRPVERRTASRAPGDRPTTEPSPRWSAADRIIYGLGVLCLAIIVTQLARGGW